MNSMVEQIVKNKNVDYDFLHTAYGLHDGLNYYNNLVTENNKLTPSEYEILRRAYFFEEDDL